MGVEEIDRKIIELTNSGAERQKMLQEMIEWKSNLGLAGPAQEHLNTAITRMQSDIFHHPDGPTE